MPVLHIQLLGDFRLTYGDQPLTAIVQARRQSSLAYLVLHRGASQRRQYLAVPPLDELQRDSARTHLRKRTLVLTERLLPKREDLSCQCKQ
jgi:DNA-binding SARP family transcriptional activator